MEWRRDRHTHGLPDSYGRMAIYQIADTLITDDQAAPALVEQIRARGVTGNATPAYRRLRIAVLLQAAVVCRPGELDGAALAPGDMLPLVKIERRARIVESGVHLALRRHLKIDPWVYVREVLRRIAEHPANALDEPPPTGGNPSVSTPAGLLRLTTTQQPLLQDAYVSTTVLAAK